MNPEPSIHHPQPTQRWVVSALVAGAVAAVAVAWFATDHRSRGLLFNTLSLAGATLALSLPIGTALAWLLVRTDLPGRWMGLLLLVVMLFVPLYLQAAAWQAGFGLQGWLTLVFGWPPWLEGWTAVVWVHATAALPWVVLIVGMGFWLVDPELEEQALLDAPAGRVFLRVSLPASAAAIGVAAVWVLIVTAGEMTVTDLFAVRTYAEELYTRRAADGRTPGQAFGGMIAGLLPMAWLVATAVVLCARLAPRARRAGVAERRIYRLGRSRLPVGGLVWLGLLGLLAVPLGNLCYKAGIIVTQTAGGRVRQWSLAKWFETVWISPIHHAREFLWSSLIGVVSATAAVLAAIVLAWWARQGGWPATAVLVLSAVLLALPGPVVGLAAIWLFSRPEIPGLQWLYSHSILAPALVLWVRSLPPATLIMWHSFRTISQETLDAAAVDGAGPITRLWLVAARSRLPAIAIAWLVALAVALGDLAASILVVPPGLTTLSIRIFGLLHYGVEDRVAGICLALVAMFAVLVLFVLWLAKRWATTVPRVSAG